MKEKPDARKGAGLHCGPGGLPGRERFDRRQPAVGVRHVAVDDAEELLLQRRGDRPRSPSPTGMRSIDLIGVISTAVPQKNASSAM